MPKHSNTVNGLTPKQIRFCQEYVIDLNGTQAAIRAGYSEDTANEQSSRMLANVNIKSYIEELKREQSKRLQITADKVLNELASIAFGDIKNIVDEDGNLKPLSEVENTKLISEIQKRVTESGEYLNYKVYDKMKALDLLGKHLSLFKEHIDITSQGDKLSINIVRPDKSE